MTIERVKDTVAPDVDAGQSVQYFGKNRKKSLICVTNIENMKKKP